MRVPLSVFRFFTPPLVCVAAFSGCRSAPPARPAAPAPAFGGVPLRGHSPDGAMLDLADGSRWFVQPAGRGATLRWQPGTPVQVSPSGHAAWPWMLNAAHAVALAKPLGPG